MCSSRAPFLCYLVLKHLDTEDLWSRCASDVHSHGAPALQKDPQGAKGVISLNRKVLTVAGGGEGWCLLLHSETDTVIMAVKHAGTTGAVWEG